jgi:hypothetical protein
MATINSIKEAVKFGEAVIHTVRGTASNEDLTRVMAHLMNTIPTVRVQADHIGWSEGVPVMNGRKGDVRVVLPNGSSTVFEAEPSDAFNSRALSQVRDLNEIEKTVVVTDSNGLEPGAEFFAQHGEPFEVTTPFTASAGVAAEVSGFAFEWTSREMAVRTATGAAARLGAGPLGVVVVSILTSVIGAQAARAVYDRYLKSYVISIIQQAQPKVMGFWARLKHAAKVLASKAKAVLCEVGQKLKEGVVLIMDLLGGRSTHEHQSHGAVVPTS